MKIVPKTGLAKFAVRITNAPSKAVASNAGSSPAKLGGSSWLTRGSDNIASEVSSIRIQSQKSFAPEFYLKSGESRDIRFRSDDEIGLFRQYNVRINGRWQRITAPPAGERDLMREAGLKASVRVAYEIIDIQGFTKKDGKKFTNVPRFFITNMRLHEQLATIRKRKGGLTKFNVNISRSGQGQSTTYTVLPDEPSRFLGIEKIPMIRKDFEKYYAPPSLEEQQAFLAHYDPSEQDNDS